MRKLDDSLLSLCQRLSDFVHSWTGLDAIHQARVLRGLGSASWFCVYVYFFHLRQSVDWIAAFGCIFRLVGALREGTGDRQARDDAAQGFRNRRQAELWSRACYWIVIPLMVWPLEDFRNGLNEMLILAALDAYFEACDVQAPRAGKIRDWLSSLAQQPQLAANER